ncbi:MAG: response regulator transcription factor [Microcoleaceae cyanobacterium]
MEPTYIAIIEGNPHLRSLLGWHLQQMSYAVCQSADLHQARELFYAHQPSLFVLDTELPGSNSLEFCKWLHGQNQSLVLMLSTRKTEADVVRALKAGADDYLAKPFGMHEFLARVEALMRRNQSAVPPSRLDYGILKIDLVQRRVHIRGAVIDLTPQEYSLLYVLAQARGEPLSRSELLQRAWPDSIDNPRTIDTHVLSLRKKMEIDPRQPNLIQTVRNVGYRLNLEVLQPSSSTTAVPISRQSEPISVQAISS